MANYQIPLSYVVNATTVPASRGLEPLQLGTILLLTEDAPVSPLDNDYIISRTASGVANVFGTETITAKMVNTIFAQTPNILNADGYVIVAPYSSTTTPATSGTLTTVDLNDNLANLQAVTNGDLTVVVDSETQTLTNLDLSGATDLSDIASIIEATLTGVEVTALNNTLIFTSNATGIISSVELTATAGGSGTDLYGASYLDGANAVAVDGEDAITTAETTAQAIERLSAQIYAEGIMTTKDLSDSEAIEASNLVEGMQNSIFFVADTSVDTLASGGLFNTLQTNDNTRKLLYLTGDETTLLTNAKMFMAAFASRGLSVNYAGSNSTITMTYKDLVNVPVDTNISETVLNQCETIGADVYCSIEGLPKVISFKQGGLYFDELTNQIWLKTTIQTTVANVLFTTRTKIPQTTQGVNTLVNAVLGVLNQGVINGMIAAGEWNSPDTFGVYEDFMRNIRTLGYYVYFTPIAEQSQADREARKCPVISIAVKQAGAIEHSNIIIYVES